MVQLGILRFACALALAASAATVAVRPAVAAGGLGDAQGPPVSVGDWLLTPYPLDTVVVEMPLSNDSPVQQTIQLRIVLLDAFGGPVKTHLTEVLRLRPGFIEWVRFTIPRAPGARSATFEVGLFGTPSDAPPELRGPLPSIPRR